MFHMGSECGLHGVRIHQPLKRTTAGVHGINTKIIISTYAVKLNVENERASILGNRLKYDVNASPKKFNKFVICKNKERPEAYGELMKSVVKPGRSSLGIYRGHVL